MFSGWKQKREAGPASEREVHAFLDAAKNGKWSYVETWLSSRPERAGHINDMPHGRWSALHQAAWWGSDDAVKMLLNLGADPTVKNKEGNTAASVARQQGDFRLGRKLLAAEKNFDRGPALPNKLELVVGNKAEALSKRRDWDSSRWEWQMFVSAGTTSSTDAIELVIMHLHETFTPQVLDLRKDKESGSFVSRKIIGWGTFEVLLYLHIRGLAKPVPVRHMLSFEDGGSSSEITIDLDQIRGDRTQDELVDEAVSAVAGLNLGREEINPTTAGEEPTESLLVDDAALGVAAMTLDDEQADPKVTEEERSQFRLVAKAAAAVAAMKYWPNGGQAEASSQPQALVASEGGLDTPRFETRASLEAAIARCNSEIQLLQEGHVVSMEALQKADRAQRELDLLLPLRKELPTVEELRERIAKLERRRDAFVGKRKFSVAMALQKQIEALNVKVQKEDEENSVKNGRATMQRIIDSDLDPEPIPLKYLEECTDCFSDERKLGEGAFSQVYLGKDKVLHRKFAVKRLRVTLNENANVKQAKRTFERELMTLKHFRHPNIARLYAFFLSPNLRGHQCLVFELAANGSLHDFLKNHEEKGKLHWTNRINIALDVAKALEYLHKGMAGQICYHRDVKSANICLRRDFRALLIDCGVAKIIPDNESNSTMTIMDDTGAGLRGTRGYICPLFAHSMKDYGSANEVFSLGIVFTELCTGILQNSQIGGKEVDLFHRYSEDGYEKRDLEKYVDSSAGDWDKQIHQCFANLAVGCICLSPGKRPSIQDIVQQLGKLASQARQWSPGERNRIQVLASAPLVWADEEGDLHPITSSLEYALERDLLVQCISEAKRDIELSFDVATDDRLQAAVTRRCGCLHFSGHGHPGYLVFEDGKGGAHFLGEQQLFDCVHVEPFKFAFVSACYSALMGKALVEAGVPHVVCCDHDEELRDDAALKFTHAFYHALAEKYTIQAAFEKGKQSVSKRLDQNEVEKFLLLPEGGDHNQPLFDADILEWDDTPQRERFIPSPPQYFVGRELDMYEVLCGILSRRLVTLIGDEGVGCSSLASAVSHFINERKTTIQSIQDVYFLRGGMNEQKATVNDFIKPLHEQLEAEGTASKLKEGCVLQDLFRIISESLVKSKALLVFDGVNADGREMTDFITFLLENTNSVKVLVTARAPIGLALEQTYYLQPLDAESNMYLLSRICPHADTPQKQDTLFRMLLHKREEVAPDGENASQQRYKLIGDGVPARTIHKAKEMTKEEFDNLCDN